MANRQDFAVIFLDVQMPGMSGFETAEMLRLNKSTKRIPLIMMTAFSNDEADMFNGYASGALDYLYKPIERGLLVSKAETFLQLWNYNLEYQLAMARIEAQNRELEEFVHNLRQGKIDTIHGEGTGAKVLKLLDKDVVDENKRLLRELERSNKEFQEFAHAASHDMKAPLHRIEQLAKFIDEDEGEKLSDDGRELMGQLRAGAGRLSQMIDRLLEFAQVDATAKAFGDVPLARVVENVVTDLAHIIEEKAARIDVRDLRLCAVTTARCIRCS